MKKSFVWYQINSVVHFSMHVLAVEDPTLYLVQPGAPVWPFALTDPQALGALLWHETVRSMASLYGPETAAIHERLFGPYEYVEPTHPPVDALVFFLECATIEGHSSGSDDYHTTLAWRVLYALMLRAIRHVPGWESLPWPTDARPR